MSFASLRLRAVGFRQVQQQRRQCRNRVGRQFAVGFEGLGRLGSIRHGRCPPDLRCCRLATWLALRASCERPQLLPISDQPREATRRGPELDLGLLLSFCAPLPQGAGVSKSRKQFSAESLFPPRIGKIKKIYRVSLRPKKRKQSSLVAKRFPFFPRLVTANGVRAHVQQAAPLGGISSLVSLVQIADKLHFLFG